MHEALEKARELLENVTPLKTDCGKVCGGRCCRPLEAEETGMLLFPGEEDFYEEISRALWGYMGDKFRIPLADLSIDAARAKLKEAHLPDEDIEQFVKTLSDCEFARFAPNSGEDMMSELYNESLEFIMNIERK